MKKIRVQKVPFLLMTNNYYALLSTFIFNTLPTRSQYYVWLLLYQIAWIYQLKCRMNNYDLFNKPAQVCSINVKALVSILNFSKMIYAYIPSNHVSLLKTPKNIIKTCETRKIMTSKFYASFTFQWRQCIYVYIYVNTYIYLSPQGYTIERVECIRGSEKQSELFSEHLNIVAISFRKFWGSKVQWKKCKCDMCVAVSLASQQR